MGAVPTFPEWRSEKSNGANSEGHHSALTREARMCRGLRILSGSTHFERRGVVAVGDVRVALLGEVALLRRWAMVPGDNWAFLHRSPSVSPKSSASTLPEENATTLPMSGKGPHPSSRCQA